jgi:hypothetical protein
MYTVCWDTKLETGGVWHVLNARGESLMWFWYLEDALAQAALFRERAPALRAAHEHARRARRACRRA